MTEKVYKMTRAADWLQASRRGYFVGSSADLRDGFIHLSSAHQLLGTFEKHFNGEDDLVLVAFEVEKLGAALKWESSRGGELFPHFYGELRVSHSLWQRPLERDAAGAPRLDEALLAC